MSQTNTDPPTSIILSDSSLPEGLPRCAIPGQPLCSSNEYTAGPGTYIDTNITIANKSAIIASVLGKVTVKRALKAESEKSKEQTKPAHYIRTVSVSRPEKAADAANAVPTVDDIVLARVLRINPRMANVAILAAGDGIASEEYGGIIRYIFSLFLVFDFKVVVISKQYH